MSAAYGKTQIIEALVTILKDMTSDWDMEFDGAIGPDTALIADLGFESIDVVQFIQAIEEHYKRRDFPFEEFFMEDGRYVDEIMVNDTAEFLFKHLN